MEAQFHYIQKDVNIECNSEEKMGDIIKKFGTKESQNINSLEFFYNGKIINYELTFNQIASKNDKKRETINIIVKDKISHEIPILVSQNDIICPICNESARISYENFKIKLYDCNNHHITENILLSEFKNTQNIDYSKLKCHICKGITKVNEKNGNEKNKEFYECLSCRIYICQKCKSKHDDNHIIINLKEKNYKCVKDNEAYTAYCETCKKNICVSCESGEHENCKSKSFGKYIPKKEELKEIKEDLNKIKDKIGKFNDIIDYYILFLKELKVNIENYYIIINNIYNYYEINEKKKYRNYQLLQNVKDIKINNQKLMKDLDQIINEKNLVEQIKNLNNMYEKMNYSNEITMEYKIDSNNDNVKIFGKCFVENNINNCKFKYNDKEYELVDYFNLKERDKPKNNILKIKLLDINKIENMHCLFNQCNNLISLPDINKWNTNKVTDMSEVFSECNSLSYLGDLSKWNTINVTNMAKMFFKCKSLQSLPDISLWNTSKVTNMKGIFYGCLQLTKLPDISKWNTENVETMESIFIGCRSLTSLPDISKWNMEKVKNIKEFFCNCNSLISLPDISKWKTNNVENMNYLFRCCTLEKIPDISKWKTDNVKNMNGIFYECKLLLEVPDLSKWNFSKVESMVHMFKQCISLKTLPDLSKWNVSKKVNMKDIFYGVNANY